MARRICCALSAVQRTFSSDGMVWRMGSFHAFLPQTAKHFTSAINRLKGRVTMPFITHELPKSLVVCETTGRGGFHDISRRSMSAPQVTLN